MILQDKFQEGNCFEFNSLLSDTKQTNVGQLVYTRLHVCILCKYVVLEICTIWSNDCLSSPIVTSLTTWDIKLIVWRYFCVISAKGSQLRPLVPLKIAVSILGWGWIWNIDGLIPTTERQSARRKGCPSASLYTTVGLGSKPGFHGEMPATDHVSHGTAWGMKFFRITRFRNSVLTSQENCSSILTTSRSMVLSEMLVYCENHTEYLSTLCRQSAWIINSCGTYSYHRVL